MKLQTHVKISKTIHVILILLLIVSFLNAPVIGVVSKRFSNVDNYSLGQLWWPFLYSVISIGIPALLLYRLISPRKMRVKIIDPKISFHPFYFENYFQNQEINDWSGEIVFGSIWLVIIISIKISQDSMDSYKENGFWGLIYFICVFINFILLIFSYSRSLSISHALMGDNSIIIEVKYISYLNNRNEGAVPYLQLGQRLECNIKNIPRSGKEERTIYIYNNHHPVKDYLLTKIEDKRLCERIKEGFTLQAELCGIEKYSILHIKLWLEKSNS